MAITTSQDKENKNTEIIQKTFDTERQALIKELGQMLDKLPQRDAIELSDAKQWINFVATFFDPDEARWHMIRARGVGGSEVGMLVRNYMGQRADFSNSGGNAHDWAMGKLLRRTPSADKPQFRRGHFMEPLIAQRLYEEYRCKRDEKEFEKLANAQGSHIWMRYSPDEMVVFDKPTQINDFGDIAQGKILVDYKAPTEVAEPERINFQYMCQLNQGATLCQEKGIEIDNLMLTRFDWKNWTLVNNIFAPDPDIQKVICLAGDHYWDYVMRGEIPRYVNPPTLELDETRLSEWAEMTQRYAQLKALVTAITNESDRLREIIFDKGGIEDGRLGDSVLEVPKVFKTSASSRLVESDVVKALRDKGLSEEQIDELQVKEKAVKYDTNAMVKKLEELGEDKANFRKRSKLDPQAAWKALLDAGLNPEEFINESKTIRIHKEYHEWARNWVADTFTELKEPQKPLFNLSTDPNPGDEEDFSEEEMSKVRMR